MLQEPIESQETTPPPLTFKQLLRQYNKQEKDPFTPGHDDLDNIVQHLKMLDKLFYDGAQIDFLFKPVKSEYYSPDGGTRLEQFDYYFLMVIPPNQEVSIDDYLCHDLNTQTVVELKKAQFIKQVQPEIYGKGNYISAKTNPHDDYSPNQRQEIFNIILEHHIIPTLKNIETDTPAAKTGFNSKFRQPNHLTNSYFPHQCKLSISPTIPCHRLLPLFLHPNHFALI